MNDNLPQDRFIERALELAGMTRLVGVAGVKAHPDAAHNKSILAHARTLQEQEPSEAQINSGVLAFANANRENYGEKPLASVLELDASARQHLEPLIRAVLGGAAPTKPQQQPQETDADNTPHGFDFGGPDTCRKCGNGREHTVHQQPQADWLTQAGEAKRALANARRVLAFQSHPLTAAHADEKRQALSMIDAVLEKLREAGHG